MTVQYVSVFAIINLCISLNNQSKKK